jgi:hypothetical protein
MNLPTSFSLLPPELVTKICGDSDLDNKDLAALRLTSKIQGIHASATKAFAKRYFTDVLLLWNKYSLETFVEITQHPIFGPSIRKIQLSCARYEESDFEDDVQELLGQGHAQAHLLAMIQQRVQRCDHDHELFTGAHVEALLDRAFGHLAKSDNSFIIAVSASEEKSLGHSKVLGPQWGSKGWWTDPCSALEFLVLAADRSSLKIQKIEIDVQAAAVCELNNLYWISTELRDINPFHSVSELTIDMHLDPDLNRVPHSDSGIVQSLLTLAVNLKILHIRDNVFIGSHTDFRDLAELISCLPLEEIHLASIHMDRDIMTDMLEGLGSNLRRLKLLDLEIWGSWKQILLCIQQHNLQLDELEIDGADRDWMWNSAVYEGTTEVRLEVARLLQARENMLKDDDSIELGLEYDSQSELDA